MECPGDAERIVRPPTAPDWKYLGSIASLPDNTFKTPSGKPHKYIDAKVVELRPEPDYEPPQSDAIAA